MVTPAHPVPVISSDDYGGWKLVTRKSKEVARRVVYPGGASNSFTPIAIDEAQIVSDGCVDPGGTLPNPYLS